MCQRLVDVGLLYHVSKELQFEDGDAVYKFDFSDNPKKVGITICFLACDLGTTAYRFTFYVTFLSFHFLERNNVLRSVPV